MASANGTIRARYNPSSDVCQWVINISIEDMSHRWKSGRDGIGGCECRFAQTHLGTCTQRRDMALCGAQLLTSFVKRGRWRKVCISVSQRDHFGKQKSVTGEEARHASLRGKKLFRLLRDEVVRSAEQRTGYACALRDPPHAAYPAMAAVHHFFADKIHQCRTGLNRHVKGSVPGERLQQRIQFLRAGCRDGVPRGPGVEGCRAMRSDGQSHPQSFVAAPLSLQLSYRHGRGL